MSTNRVEELSQTKAALYEVQIISQASELLNSALEVGEVVSDTLILMCKLIEASCIVILLEEGERLKTFYVHGEHAKQIADRTWEKNRHGYELIVSENGTTLISDLSDSEYIPAELIALFNTPNSSLCVPIVANEQKYGALLSFKLLEAQFSPDHLRIADRFAGLLGDAFNRSFRYTEKAHAEARYHTLLDDSIIPIVVVNRFGIIQMVNRSATELMGYYNHQLMGESINILHGKEIFDAIRTNSDSNEDGTIKLETEIITQEEQIIPVELHVRLTRSGEFQWMYRDISEELLVDQMRNDLTAMLVHDLKGPLTNILTSLEILTEDLGDDEGSEESIAGIMLQVASRSGQWLHHLVHSLLDVSQLEAGSAITDKQIVSVKEVVDSAKEIIAARLEAQSVSLAVHIPDEFPPIYANEEMLKRVFLNLVDNALKFTPYGSTITVAAVQNTPDKVELSIADEGPGVPVEHHDSIFDKFYRTPDNKTKGIGLGLAFCGLVVEGHGGRIWVDPDSGGAKFIFTMPLANDQS